MCWITPYISWVHVTWSIHAPSARPTSKAHVKVKPTSGNPDFSFPLYAHNFPQVNSRWQQRARKEAKSTQEPRNGKAGKANKASEILSRSHSCTCHAVLHLSSLSDRDSLWKDWAFLVRLWFPSANALHIVGAEQIPAHLGVTADLVADHGHKANRAIKWAAWFIWFPSTYQSYVYVIL